MVEVKLSPWLLSAIRNGEAILFLGAGASIGAKLPNGAPSLTGPQLRDLLSDTFLGGKHKNRPLDRVADYAKNLSSFSAVQSFIRAQFEPLQPAPFHYVVPTLRWFAIVTTNFDLIMERSYDNVTNKLQKLAPIIRDGDNFTEKLRDPQLLPYLKLHGCINTINDPELPLILTSEEYAKYEHGRTRLFSHLKEWGREHPIIFCGYDIGDPHIQHILFDLNDLGISRPLYALVNPSLDELDEQVWRSRRFETVPHDFSIFLKYLNDFIPPHVRILSSLNSKDALPISRRFTSQTKPSDQLIDYLTNELEYLYDGMPLDGIDPKDFYHGLLNSWSAYHQHLDVRRRITDDILLNWVLDESHHTPVSCFLLKGHAGSGKNVTLKRVAWEAACQFDKVVFFLREGGLLREELIYELFTLIKTRIILFLSDATQNAEAITKFIAFAKNRDIHIAMICGARTNEWNVYGGNLSPDIDGEYDLRDLTEKEIVELLTKLEKYNCLGHLNGIPIQKRKDYFKLTSERQLLVALHEATSGKTFEEIVLDEYERIVPSEAKILYLDICTLHRLRATVRAGLISRISGITFEDFQKRLLEPLEMVVRVYKDSESRDYAYRTRHPLIAKFVFEHALKQAGERADQIVRMLRYLNVDYKCDEDAFSHLIRGRELAELFADRKLADQIYRAAEETGASEAHICHQMAVFELHHSDGSTRGAMEAIRKAESHAKRGLTAINHTKAMILRRMALDTTNELEKERYRSDAKNILGQQLNSAREPHEFTGMAQILLDEIRERVELLSSESADGSEDRLQERLMTKLIGEAEDIIYRGQQKFPEDGYFLLLEANLSEIIHNKPRAIRALYTAFQTTPRSDAVAIRLALYYVQNEKISEGEQVLKKCLEYNPDSKRVHLQLAMLYINQDVEKYKDVISYHLKRSFTEGDSNHGAQMQYARHEFIYGRRNEAEKIFKSLGTQKFSPEFKNKHWGEVKDKDGQYVQYSGRITNIHDSFCFIDVIEVGASIFAHFTEFDHEDWEVITEHTLVSCNLAFRVKGACGIRVKVVA